MTTPAAPADTTPAASVPASPAAPPVPAAPSWPWRRGALILAGAAQLITISALVTSDYPLAATWWSLLLGIAPAPVAAAAAFAPAPVGRLAAATGVLVLVAGRGRDRAHRPVLRPGARGAGRQRGHAVA
jgi:hypothetical protein